MRKISGGLAAQLGLAMYAPITLALALDTPGKAGLFAALSGLAALMALAPLARLSEQVVAARKVTTPTVPVSQNLVRELQSERARFLSLITHSTDVIAVVDGKGVISYISPAAERVFGYPPERLIGRNVLAFAHSADSKRVRRIMAELKPGATSLDKPKRLEIRFRQRSGEARVLEIALTDLRLDPAVDGIVLNARDVTERKALEEDLRRRVLHDSLTGIANRVLFRDCASHALTKRAEGEQTVALFIDVDDFKTVNDALGHSAGDELLQVLAFRLTQSVREADTVARLSGDEFAVLLENIASVEDAQEIAAKLMTVLGEPVEIDGTEVSVSVSMGLAISEERDVDAFLRNADVAMYHAKAAGKARVEMFHDTMHRSVLERLEMKADLAHAVGRHELRLAYQPLIDIPTGELKGFEALVRWEHPKRGLILPGAFMSLAEETGLIIPIGEWVMAEATRQLGLWQRRFARPGLTMSVNISPLQLLESDIVEAVENALDQASVDPETLIVELTEGTVLDDPMARKRLHRLGELGVDIAADDFGTGFASYASLQQLPFTILKIDRSLLNGMWQTEGRAEAQLQSIIDMAHATGVRVVGEGVETHGQLKLLQEMGCDIGQGFFFARPAFPDEAENLLGVNRRVWV